MASNDPIRLLVIEDERAFQRWLSLELPQHGFAVTAASTGREGLEAAEAEDHAVALLDLNLPDQDGLEVLRQLRASTPLTQVVVLTGHGSIDVAVNAMKAGAEDFLTKPCQLEELSIVLHKAAERGELRRRFQSLRRLVGRSGRAVEIVGRSPVIRSLLHWIERAAGADAPVLVLGESGTGKELVARALHGASARSDQPFVAVNCSVLSRELLESELFGHVRGAFTGAVREHFGLFEDASGGTLLLDEIGEMPPELQSKLLRVLESGEYRRVGETKVRNADVRIVAATNRDLETDVREGSFREDLYFRLNVLQVTVPPLRQRGDDVLLLAAHFLERHRSVRRACSLGFSDEALACLRAYHWPGNVRELENLVERLAILCESDTITPAELPLALARARAGAVTASGATAAAGGPPAPGASVDPAASVAPGALGYAPGEDPTRLTLAEVETRHVLKVLELNQGNKAKTARDLGVDPKTLYKRLRDCGLLSNES